MLSGEIRSFDDVTTMYLHSTSHVFFRDRCLGASLKLSLKTMLKSSAVECTNDDYEKERSFQSGMNLIYL